MKKILLVCVALLFCSPAFAEDERPSIVASESQARASFTPPAEKIAGAEKPIGLGKMIRLRIAQSGNRPSNLASSSYRWKVYDYNPSQGELVESDDPMPWGDSVVFGAGIEPKKMQVLCVATHLFIVYDNKDKSTVKEVGTRTVVYQTSITIGSPTPPPPGPGPNPGPNPNPDIPDGKFKLSKVSYQASSVVPPASRPKGAAALSRSFRGIASAIAAGTVKDLKDGLAKSKDANNQALKDAGVSVGDWDNFGAALQDAVFELYRSKKLTTVSDLADAWGEVARGLDYVR